MSHAVATDDTWSLVVFTLPDKRSLHRNAARRLLQSLEGRRIQSCTWLLEPDAVRVASPRLERLVARAGGELYIFPVDAECTAPARPRLRGGS